MGRPPTKTKQNLIDTAIELLWRNSYGSVSVDGICEKAAVNKGSFYYYFKTKAELAIAALEDHCKKTEPLFSDVFSIDKSPAERFSALADAMYAEQKEVVEKYGQVCGCPFMTLGSEMAGQDESIRKKVEDVHREHQAFLESTIQDLVEEGALDDRIDVKARASQVNGFILGQVTLARIHNSLEPLQNNLKEGMFRILGIQASQGVLL